MKNNKFLKFSIAGLALIIPGIAIAVNTYEVINSGDTPVIVHLSKDNCIQWSQPPASFVLPPDGHKILNWTFDQSKCVESEASHPPIYKVAFTYSPNSGRFSNHHLNGHFGEEFTLLTTPLHGRTFSNVPFQGFSFTQRDKVFTEMDLPPDVIHEMIIERMDTPNYKVTFTIPHFESLIPARMPDPKF